MILVGRIIKHHGLHGGVKCRIIFKNLQNLSSLMYYDGSNLKRIFINSISHMNGEIWVLYFDQITRYASASHLSGVDLFTEAVDMTSIDQSGSSALLRMDVAIHRSKIESDENLTYIIGFSMGVLSVGENKLLCVNFPESNLVAKNKIGIIYIPFVLSTFPMVGLSQSTIFINPYWIN